MQVNMNSTKTSS